MSTVKIMNDKVDIYVRGSEGTCIGGRGEVGRERGVIGV